MPAQMISEQQKSVHCDLVMPLAGAAHEPMQLRLAVYQLVPIVLELLPAQELLDAHRRAFRFSHMQS
jgi:hypothetical protein